MKKRKVKILKAISNNCEFCEGIIYKIEIDKYKALYQCKCCGNTYEKGSY